MDRVRSKLHSDKAKDFWSMFVEQMYYNIHGHRSSAAPITSPSVVLHEKATMLSSTWFQQAELSFDISR